MFCPGAVANRAESPYSTRLLTNRQEGKPVTVQSTARISASAAPFVRDRFTLTAYVLLAYFAYLQSLLGPVMPFLRGELGLSYVVGSLHLSAFAAGMVLIGLVGDRILRRIGARATLWGGAIGMAAGAIALILGTNVIWTIAAAGAMGVIGTLLLVAQQAGLAHHHGARRAVAFTEANILASVGSMLAPLAVGAAVGGGVGWRLTLLLPLPLLAWLLLREVRQPVPAPEQPQGSSARGRLPRRFWAYWLVASLGVAVEWCVGFWGADFLHTVGGLPLEVAVTAMALYFMSMLVGRITGSALTRQLLPSQLLVMALLLGLVGLLLFWQAPHIVIALLGLVLAGVGIGNLFPLSLSVAVEAASTQAAAASARMTLAGGLAILTAPLALGSWADSVGLSAAFAVVPALLVIALVVAAGMNRAWR